jgi:arginase
MNINLLGVPFNSDGTPPEKENPASALRQAGLTKLLKSLGHSLTDIGDIAIPIADGCRDDLTGVLNLHALQETSRRLAVEFDSILDRNDFSIILGGDCAILIGIFGAFAARDLEAGLLFFDGHADFQSKEMSPTGEAADFELAFLTGRGPESITTMFGKCPLVSDGHVVAYGVRECDLITETNIHVYSAEDMLRRGIPQSISEGLDQFTDVSVPLWLHFDVDVIDPGLLPVLIPAAEGLSFEQAEEFLTLSLSMRHFLGMSVACYHPSLDRKGNVGRRISEMITNAVTAIHQ